MDTEFVLLHNRRDLTQCCVELLNSEWPRSQALRERNLEKSNDDLPCSIVMLERSRSGREKVVGYCKISRVLGMADSVVVESVVVSIENRGRGLGRRLMENMEDIAQRFGFKKVYLSTHDKQGFYERLGYNYSKSVSVLKPCSLKINERLLKKLDASVLPNFKKTTMDLQPNGPAVSCYGAQNCDVFSKDSVNGHISNNLTDPPSNSMKDMSISATQTPPASKNIPLLPPGHIPPPPPPPGHMPHPPPPPGHIPPPPSQYIPPSESIPPPAPSNAPGYSSSTRLSRPPAPGGIFPKYRRFPSVEQRTDWMMKVLPDTS
ncbi:NAT6 [Branchiostoma lanceolatum]|uniref:NAT6 protein n=1 Tax=Branchiostoma lanceolatum TaxID=7740 RepID=A0A8S4MPU3_BRALA|nr:NAT6 [Branchiostoma lanceolatum]